jgi:hypothetical protein
MPAPRVSLKAAFQRVANAFRIQSRLEELGDKLLAALEKKDVPPPYRNCPNCGAHDLRLQDRHRYKPNFFSDQRYVHENGAVLVANTSSRTTCPNPESRNNAPSAG